MREALAVVRGGNSRVVAVAGDAGIGKTSFVEFALKESVSEEFETHFAGFFTETPGYAFRPFPAVIRRLASGRQSEDLQVARRFSEQIPESVAVHDVDRKRLFAEILQVVERACAEKGQILVFEDIHDIDGPSAALISYLCHQIRQSRLAVIVTCRTAEAKQNPHADALLDELRQNGNFIGIELAPLSFHEVTVLARHAIPALLTPQHTQWLYDRTRGNPFYFWAFIDTIAVQKDGYDFDATEIPDSVLSYIHKRLEELDENVRRVITIAAVAGSQVDYELIVKCMEGADEALDHVDGAIRAGVLFESAPGTLSFTHDLVRESLLLNLSTRKRVEIHLQIARILEADDNALAQHAAALAYHYRGAIPSVGRGPYVRYSIAATREAIKALAFEDAIEFADSALGMRLDKQQEAELHFRRGQARVAMSEASAGAEDLRRSFELFRQVGDVPSALEAAQHPIISYPVITAVADLASAALEIAVDERDIARLSVPHAFALYHADFDARRAIDRLRSSVEVLRRDEVSEHLNNAIVCLAQVLFWESRMDESLELCEDLTESRSSMSPITRVLAHHYASFNNAWNGNLASAQYHAEAALRAADRLGHTFLQISGLVQVQQLLYFRARLTESAENNDRCLKMPVGASIIHAAAVRLSVQLDHMGNVEGHLKQITDMPDFRSEWSQLFDAMCVAEAGFCVGDESLLRWADDIVGQRFLTSPAPLYRFVGWYTKVLCSVGFGTPELIPDAPQGVLVPKTFELRLRPLLALRTQDQAEIARQFSNCYAELKATDRLIYSAWLLYEQVLLAPPPDKSQTIALLDRVIKDATSNGLPTLKRLASERRTALLGALGTSPKTVVSARESEVLDLIATGATNGEIAKRLFISDHTVANHVRSLLRKTGLHNRTELARYALNGESTSGSGPSAHP